VTATTRLPGISAQEVSPTLLFHRWHDYDRFETEKAFKTSESRRHFLLAVAESVQQTGKKTYGTWHAAFHRATEDVGGQVLITAPTAWRMVTGWATNPALEAGIVLDHLTGFPLVPGSGIKGLLHHVAEMELVETDEWAAPIALPTGGPPAALRAALDAALDGALLVRVLFGSLFVERLEVSENELHGPEGPKGRFSRWLALIDGAPDRDSEAWRETRERISKLLSLEPVGGMVTCFDAVPSPAEWEAPDRILQVDILNPHYSPYYQPGAGPAVLPIDSSSPSPVHFLAVRPGVQFEFRVKLTEFPSTAGHVDNDSDALVRRQALGARSRPEVLCILKHWLQKGLDEWGVGAKTAAGYGYFEFPDAAEAAATHLPIGLEPGRLGSVVDAAFGLPSDVQAAVARRLSQHYKKEIASWRKKDKPAVKKRLEWLATFSGGGAG
jgi:CRISPR type III-B/RAMP module RAMP protein Cmr6